MAVAGKRKVKVSKLLKFRYNEFMEQRVYPIQSRKDLAEAWLVAVSMGYGHQRTAYPLKYLASGGEIIKADNYPGIPEKDKKIWEGSRKFYEFISNFKRTPLIGNLFFLLFDCFQKISGFYPERDLSKPNLQLKQIFSLIKKGWGRHLIEKCKMQNAKLPFVSTFFPPVFMAETFSYPGEIFCIICDADISRTWASLNPQESRIKYLAPTERVVERLKLCGVKPENIFLTGYPLPLENTGDESLEIAKNDLRHRLLNLDPKGRYFRHYEPLIKKYLGELPKASGRPLTLMFAVGGVGAQKEIGIKIAKSLQKSIKEGNLRLILVAGARKEVKEYFEREISGGRASRNLGENVEILYQEKIEDYFKVFNEKLRTTDILWTKPSELSFYTALGIPMIIAPTIGSQEEFNKRWLLKSGFGLAQENPSYANQWLFDWLEKGYLAEAAMQGFIEGEKMGTFKIKHIITQIGSRSG